jgi:phosphoribosylformylglycinamidine synthase
MKRDAVVAIQDMGAAGLTSSSVEMAGRGGTGLRLHVDRIPRREDGMTPYECLLSESQERMLIVAAAGREHVVEEVFRKWDLEAVVVGEVTDDGLWRIVEDGAEVAVIPVLALTDDAPNYDRPRAVPADLKQRQATPDLAAHGDSGEVLRRLLASPGIADKRWVYRQYDHMVRVGTLLRPGAADAAVLRMPGSEKSLAVCVDGNSVHVKLDPFTGAQGVIAEAARNLACTGAEAIGATDCLNFGNPERPDVMWEFEQAVLGLGEGLRRASVPIVSGNVSFYNETGEQSIHPTPTIGMIGLIDEGVRPLGMALPSSGSLVLLGSPRQVLGGSTYARVIHGSEQGMPPQVHWDEELALHALLREAARQRLLLAAHDVSDGGIATSLAEMLIASRGEASGCSIQLPLSPEDKAIELGLFGETHGCVWVVVDADSCAELLALCQHLRCRATVMGAISGEGLRILDAQGNAVVDESCNELCAAWEDGFTSSIGLSPCPPRV